MADTSIEWTRNPDGSEGKTWNPSTGCDRVSAGCDHCYALTMAKRLKGMGSAKYQNDGDPRTSGPGFGLTIHPDSLNLPRSWKKPQRVFVNSMSDLFHAKVPLDFVRQVFGVIADTPQHTYQVLTKRSLRLARVADQLDWPPNLWMGVSVENASEMRRVEHLLEVPAAVRFLSCEPLIGPLKLTVSLMVGMACDPPDGIGWVIAGGESGPGARPMDPAWPREIRDACVAAGVPFFFKQWGEHTPYIPDGADGRPDWDRLGVWVSAETGETVAAEADVPDTGSWQQVWRVGKKAAGRELDGEFWDEFPAVPEVAARA